MPNRFRPGLLEKGKNQPKWRSPPPLIFDSFVPCYYGTFCAEDRIPVCRACGLDVIGGIYGSCVFLWMLILVLPLTTPRGSIRHTPFGTFPGHIFPGNIQSASSWAS